MHIRASVKNCKFSSVTIKNDDGSNASLAEIIQCFPLLEKFEFTGESVSSHITATTVKELIKIPHFSNIKKFTLHHIPAEFDIEEFYVSFLKKNKTMDIELLFDENNSDAYNQRVETVMNKILLESKINDIWPPIIFYGTIINELTLKLYSAHKRASKYLKEFCYLWIFCFSAPCLGGLFGDIKNWYSNTFSSL
uniref:DUF38 domain-containing protein n=1 Tax=Panagrolaimus davidi TaxID=227884 RepID=A0A914PCV9_9BILA